MINQDCNKVKCELCGRLFRQITDTHLRKAHEITFAEYKQTFPNSTTLPSDIHAALSEIATQKVADGIIGFHEGHTVNAWKTPWNKGTHGLQESWRKGKTKENNEIVARGGRKLSETLKRKLEDGTFVKRFGKDNPMFGKKLTESHMAALWGGWKGPGTKAELKMKELLSPYEEWEYTANGKFIIKTNTTHKVPDFTNKHKKRVIEVFGDYWHRGENPQGRIEEYRQAGWDCVVVWEHEVMDENYSIESLSTYL